MSEPPSPLPPGEVAPAAPAEKATELLSPRAFWLCVAVAVGVFLIVDNPITGDPFAIDASIIWSYLVIPPLVFFALRREHKLSRVAFVAENVRMVAVKFGITYALATAMWIAAGDPPDAVPTPPAAHAVAAVDAGNAPVVPTPIDPATTVTVAGRVTDDAGQPVAGASVWIAGGLDAYVFAPPTTAVHIDNAGEGAGPAPILVQRGQPIEMRSLDGQLHNAIATTRDGERLFNVPLLPDGEGRRVHFDRAVGRVQLTCAVHEPQGEAATEILVLGHPFFTVTGDDGAFRFAGVPTANVQLHAARPSGAPATVEVEAAGSGP